VTAFFGGAPRLGKVQICCFGGIGGCRSTDSQWITAGPQRHPFFRPRETFRHTKSAVRAIFGCTTGLGQAKIRVFDEAPLERREANYHYHGSVDISTNAPIEDRTKGRDSLRCNLPLAKQKSAVRATFGVF